MCLSYSKNIFRRDYGDGNHVTAKTKRHMSSDCNLEDVLLLFWLISDAAVVCVSLGIDARNSFLWFIHLCFSHSQFDTNGDGQISTAELREAMKKLLGQQVWRCWERLSFSLELSINHDACLHLLCLLHLCVVPEIYATYIHTFPTNWLFQVGHRDLEDILRDIDLNGDGHVDFEGEESYAIWDGILCNSHSRTHFTAYRAWKSNMLAQHLSLLVCFHHSVSLLNTHIFHSISNPNMCGWYPNTMLIVKWGDEGSRSACQIISIARDYGTS